MPDRYLSPALHNEDALSLLIAPLSKVDGRIYNDIWNAVIDRKLLPGAKLEETVLCEIYGVSRTIIRKVMVILEQTGIVSLPLNRGAFIAVPTPRDTLELLETVTAMLVHIATQLAATPKRITPAQRKLLAMHVEAERNAEAQHNFHSSRRLRAEYGTLLGLIHGNHILTATLERDTMRFTLALAAYQTAPAAGGGADMPEKLNELIYAGVPKDVEDFINAFTERVRKTLRFETDEAQPDLRTILGKGQQ